MSQVVSGPATRHRSLPHQVLLRVVEMVGAWCSGRLLPVAVEIGKVDLNRRKARQPLNESSLCIRRAGEGSMQRGGRQLLVHPVRSSSPPWLVQAQRGDHEQEVVEAGAAFNADADRAQALVGSRTYARVGEQARPRRRSIWTRIAAQTGTTDQEASTGTAA